jgi:hypothetical protein
MSKRMIIIIILGGLLILTGCDTDDSKTDAAAAQSFFPTYDNYTIQGSESTQDAIVTALGGTAAMTGNPIMVALVERVDTLLDCYREVGAVDAKVYLEKPETMGEVRAPIAGVLLVINQDRVVENFASCITTMPFAQKASVEFCSGFGTFEFEDDTIHYFYGATNTPLCDMFQTHFSAYGG